jgi:hypothetical protein
MSIVVSPGPEGTDQKECVQFRGCAHEDVDWDPANLEYGAQGLAVVIQFGRCRDCKHAVEVSADLEYVTVVTTED